MSARTIVWIRPKDRNWPNQSLRNPKNGYQEGEMLAEFASSNNFADASTTPPAGLGTAMARFQFSRNPPATNATEKIGSSYRMTCFGFSGTGFDCRYAPGTLHIVDGVPVNEPDDIPPAP